MREGQNYAIPSERSLADHYPSERAKSDPNPQGSAENLDRAVMAVERMVDEVEKLLVRITGPRNSGNKAEVSPPRPVPTLARMLEQTPAAISVQYDRAAKLMEEIRAALQI